MSKPKVLISDALSPAAVQIFKDRGVEVDFQPNLGKDKDKLAEIIGNYDGLAIRSATKATAKIIEKATRLKVIGRAGIGVDNVDILAASKQGVIVMNTPFGNSITTAEHAITLMLALARQIPQADASTQAGKWEKNRFMGVEVYAKCEYFNPLSIVVVLTILYRFVWLSKSSIFLLYRQLPVFISLTKPLRISLTIFAIYCRNRLDSSTPAVSTRFLP